MALLWLARIVVGGLFIIAALGKIDDPTHFAGEIQSYRMVPVAWTHALAFIVPWIELVGGAMLILGLWRAEARLLVLLMLVVFTIAKISAYARGLRISCGCFGGWFASLEGALQGFNGILLNFVLLALALVDLIGSRRVESLARKRQASASGGEHEPQAA